MGSIENPTQGDSHLPVIDFSKWTSPNASAADRSSMAKDLVEACHYFGFVYIINHGISEAVVREAFSWSKRFFDLDQDKKMQAVHPEGSQSFRGFSPVGLEKAASSYPGQVADDKVSQEVIDFTESYGLGSDKNEAEPNVWLPESTLPGFREFIDKFYGECWKSAENIIKALAVGLGSKDEDLILKHFTGDHNEISLRHYPQVAESVIATQAMRRLGAHTDFDCLTMLFQDDCGGLEVQKAGKPAEFLHAAPLENALIMNIGDLLMRWSNDYLVSTIHRVHLPPLEDRYVGAERMTRERFSIPYFVSPSFDTMVECLPICQSETEPPKYEPILFKDYYHERASQVFTS